MPVQLTKIAKLTTTQRTAIGTLPCCGLNDLTPPGKCNKRQQHTPSKGGVVGFCSRCVKVYPAKYSQCSAITTQFSELMSAYADLLSSAVGSGEGEEDEPEPEPEPESEAEAEDGSSNSIRSKIGAVRRAYIAHLTVPTFKCPGITIADMFVPGHRSRKVIVRSESGQPVDHIVTYVTCTSPVSFRCGKVGADACLACPDHATMWDTAFQPADPTSGILNTEAARSHLQQLATSAASSKEDVSRAFMECRHVMIQWLAQEQRITEDLQAAEDAEEAAKAPKKAPATKYLQLANIIHNDPAATAMAKAFATKSATLRARSEARKEAAKGKKKEDQHGATSAQPQGATPTKTTPRSKRQASESPSTSRKSNQPKGSRERKALGIESPTTMPVIPEGDARDTGDAPDAQSS